jgi:hypothetical protein
MLPTIRPLSRRQLLIEIPRKLAFDLWGNAQIVHAVTILAAIEHQALKIRITIHADMQPYLSWHFRTSA